MSIALEDEHEADVAPQGGRILSNRRQVWEKFKRHKVALVSLWFIVALYVIVLIGEFVAPYDPFTRNSSLLLAPPTPIITSPKEGVLYKGGQKFKFSGRATDPEDGKQWLVGKQH